MMTEVVKNLDVEDVFDFLVNLRDSGVCNMWGASTYIQEHFECSADEAKYWLVAWIKTFSE